MTRMVLAMCVAIVVAVPGSGSSATLRASDCGRAAVAAAIALAVDGDTVVIPAGTASWTQTLTIDKAITLQGAGVGNTVILDDVSESSHAISVTLVANKTTRITGIEFGPGSRTAVRGFGIIRVDGTNLDSRRIRIDHCKFDQLYSEIFFLSTVLGVIDNNTFNLRSGITAGLGYVKCSGWDGHSYGDGAWAAADQFGTDQFIFFEDNEISYLGPSHVTLLDAQAGGRYVARYNRISRGSFEGHGTESGGRERSTRAVEIYNNTFTGIDTQATLVYMRGGVGLIHDNAVTGYTTIANFFLLTNRSITAFSAWGGADGTNSWDKNVAGGPLATGTVASAGVLTMTVSGSPWTANQWAGYSVKRTTNLRSLAGQTFAEIASNTSNTITYRASIYGDNLVFTAGDTYQFWKVDHALDQVGRSGGSLVTGDTPVVPRGWNDQTTSPWYEWNNTREGGANIDITVGWGPIRVNEHYFNDTEAPGYRPYAYPHPLRLGVQPLSPPANLRVIR